MKVDWLDFWEKNLKFVKTYRENDFLKGFFTFFQANVPSTIKLTETS